MYFEKTENIKKWHPLRENVKEVFHFTVIFFMVLILNVVEFK